MRIQLALSLLLLLVGHGAAADEVNPVRRQPAAAAMAGAEQRIIVKFRQGNEPGRATAQAAAAKVAGLMSRAGVRLQQTRPIAAGLHVMLIDPEISGVSLDERLTRIRADAAVEYAEVDRRRYVNALPNDLQYFGQWYLQRASRITASAINAEQAWDITTGSAGVVVADIDTGVLFDHPDLQRASNGGRLLPGYDFVADVAAANDGDGRDADAADPGDWLTASEAALAIFRGCDPRDSSWHGTRVAGILGALTDNSAGIAGITWTPWILPVRVLGKCGGYDSDILAGMLWAAGIHVDGVPDNPYPARIENLSIGAIGACPASYRDVIAQLAARGVLVVVSAGNEGGPVDTPANCAGVAAVAGLRHAGTKVGYSNVGPEVALSAPAGNCVNTIGACLYSISTTSNVGATAPGTHSYTDQLNFNVGTSFSAPIVAAIATLMVSVNGNLSAANLLSRLKEGARGPFPVSTDAGVPQCRLPVGPNDLQATECSCTTAMCGAGMADAPGALTAALRPVAAVAIAARAGRNLELSGAGSGAACGYAISNYTWSVVEGTDGIAVANTDPAVAVVVVPSADATFTARLTVTDNAGRQDTADVRIGSTGATTAAPESAGTNACPAEIAPPVAAAIAVTVAPPTASVQASGGKQTFTATLVNSASQAVVWRVDGVTGGNATVGTVSAAGVYSAPVSVPSPATVTVTAASSEDQTRIATAQVAITAAPVAPAASTGSSGGGGAADLLSVLGILSAALLLRRRAPRARAAPMRLAKASAREPAVRPRSHACRRPARLATFVTRTDNLSVPRMRDERAPNFKTGPESNNRMFHDEGL